MTLTPAVQRVAALTALLPAGAVGCGLSFSAVVHFGHAPSAHSCQKDWPIGCLQGIPPLEIWLCLPKASPRPRALNPFG